jgi:RHS repeat-associated protein
MLKSFFFIFVFFLSFLFSNQAITPYLTSENDTLSLVEGIVNAYNGKLVQIDKDIEIQGNDPLTVLRYYDGGHHFEGNYGYSVGFSFPLLLAYDPFRSKQNILVEQREGSYIYFSIAKMSIDLYGGKADSELFEYGYTNCCESLLRGESDVYAMSVAGDGLKFIVDLGNGVKRHYQLYCKTNQNIFLYRLIQEDRPNGNIRHFAYDNEKTRFLSKVWTTNRENTIVLNSLDITKGVDHFTINASNGQYARYDYALKKGKGKIKKDKKVFEFKYNYYVLSNVSGSQICNTQYDHISRTDCIDSILSTKLIKRPDGRFLEVEYDKNEKIKIIKIAGIDKPLHTFDYKIDQTHVIDALGNKKTYEFSKRRLIKLSEPHKTQKYEWNHQGQLLSHTTLDLAGNIHSKREYDYDSNGYIIETKVSGNIRNCGSNDCYKIRYIYSKDGLSNLLSENHNNEIEFTFSYSPGTNLVTRKLTFADQCFVEREFFKYDKNGLLIQKVKDDGGMPEFENLFNVSYRQISRYVYQMDPKLPGMTLPKVIEEWSFDPRENCEKLLKVIEKIYTVGDLLAEEKVYDSNRNYCYSVYFEYNNRRELVRKTDPLGQQTIYRYDDNENKIYEEVIGSNKKTIYVYDQANRLVQEIEEHSNGAIFNKSHTYDAMSNKLSTTNIFGQTTTYKYDASGRETASFDPFGKGQFKEYDIQGNLVKQIDEDGYVTHTTHNLFGKPLKVVYPDGTTKRYAYNLKGHVVEEWDRDGIHKVYECNYLGHPKAIKVYGPDESVLKCTQKIYKGAHLLQEIDPMGNTVTYQYDGAGRMICKIQGDQTICYEHDHLGRLSRTITDDTVVVKVYDFLDRVVEERTEDLSGAIYRKTTCSYDLFGNKTLERVFTDNDDFYETKTLHNSNNQPIVVIDPLGNQTTMHYYYTDHLEKESIDSLGRKKQEIYDKLNRLSTVNLFGSDGKLLSCSSYTYDGRGNKIFQQDRNLFLDCDFGTFEVKIIYDGMGQKIAEIEQGEKVIKYTYQNGRLHQIIKPDSVTLTHSYDLLGRLNRLVSSEETIHYCYTYDLNDNLIQVKDLVLGTTILRSYDSLNRLIYERQATGFDVSYKYDALNRLKEVLFRGEKLVYNYSPANLISINRYKDECLLYSFTQQVNWVGKAIDQTLPNGLQIGYQWDGLSRCSDISSTTFQQSFEYDNIGNLIFTKIQDPLGEYDVDYSYDQLNQICQETGPLCNKYAFDSLSNRRELNEQTFSFNGLNQLTFDGNFGYFYDKNGNRISKGVNRYCYDALDRLTSVQLEGDTITFKYDSFGRRIERHGADESVQYFYQFDTEIGTIVNGTVVEFRAIYDQFTPFAIEAGDKVYSLIKNHRGDICVLLSEQGGIVATYRYDAFGNFSYQGSVKSPWTFSSQRYDEITKLYHFSKREYDSSCGRWLTPDPLGFADGPNLYAYVHNNPMIYVDPYGLWGESLYSIYSQSKQFCSGFSRGFVDDTTFGASGYIFGQYDHSSLSSKVGYYAGTGCSMAAGLMYGGTWLKGVQCGGKAAINAYRLTRNFSLASKTSKNLIEARSVVQLTHELPQINNNIFNFIKKSNGVINDKRTNESAKILFDSWDKGTFPNRMQSIRYHFFKHANGRSVNEYTRDAISFFNKNKNSAKEVILKNGQQGYSIKMKCNESRIGGFWTKDEKIITFWD